MQKEFTNGFVGVFPVRSEEDGSKIVFSRLQEYTERQRRQNAVSFKYVIHGQEQYHCNNREHLIGEGQYLLLNAGQGYEGQLDHRHITGGICVDIHVGLLQDVYTNETHSEQDLLDNPSTASWSPDFFERVYTVKPGPLQYVLGLLKQSFVQGKTALTPGIYYELASVLLQEQVPVRRSIDRIPMQRKAVKEELYRRLLTAKEILDSSYSETWDLKRIACEARLSPFHFLRLFKQVFGTTPHRYLTERRLSYARELLLNSGYQVAEVASMAGFGHAQNLVKALKKKEQIVPSQLKRRGK